MTKVRNIEELNSSLIEGTVKISEGKMDYHSSYIDEMLVYCRSFINNKEKLQNTDNFSEISKNLNNFVNAVRNKGSELLFESTSGCDFDLVDQRSTFIERMFKKIPKKEINSEMIK